YRLHIQRNESEVRDPEFLQVVQPLDEAWQIANAVGIRVEERPEVQLVDDGVLVPERVVGQQRVVLHVVPKPLSSAPVSGVMSPPASCPHKRSDELEEIRHPQRLERDGAGAV